MSEVWLTYAQAGERFGLTSDAMRMRARRLGWRSQPRNDGCTLILVPDDTTIQPRALSPDGSSAHATERTAEQSEVIERFLDQIEAADARAASAEHRIERAEQRVERAEQRADAERARGDQLRERLEIAHGVLTTTEKRAAQLRESLDIAERRAREAEDAAAVLREVAAAQRQAEAERKAKGLLARLRDAWTGK